jgi:colanic acid/amylovoran biosynthesis glycosyltransferase
MPDAQSQLTVLHGKFTKYLSWSQSFLYELIRRLGAHVRNGVLCEHTENLERFPTRDLYRIQPGDLADEPRALLVSAAAGKLWSPQILHAHFGSSGIRMAVMRQFMRIPLVTTFGGKDVGYEMNLPEFAPLYSGLFEISERMVCVSEDLKRQLIARGAPEKRIMVIRRGTDLQWYAFVDRSQHDEAGPVRLLMVSRFVRKKGHRYALRAVHDLIAAGERVHLTIVGEGDQLRPLLDLRQELKLTPHVDFVGSTDSSGVLDRYWEADILLHPSITSGDGDTEGLPNVVVEAAATGLPAVATRHGGIVEAVQHQKTGILVGERDVDGIVAAVTDLVHDRQRRLSLGWAAAHFARERFDIDHQVTAHLELYKELVDRYPASAPRMQRTFLGQRYFSGLRRATLERNDESIVAQIEALSNWWAEKRGAPIFRPPSPMRVNSVRRHAMHIPESVRFLVRRCLLSAVTGAVTSTTLRGGGHDEVLTEDLRRAVIDFVDRRGDLAAVDPTWDGPNLAKFLSIH